MYPWNFYNNGMQINSNEDGALFADDTSLELCNIEDIAYKLHAYNTSAWDMGLQINWEKSKR